MSETQFPSLTTQHATEAELGRMVGHRAEQRSIRASRISRLSLLAVVVAAFAAAVAYRSEVQFVAGDIFSKFRSSSAYTTAEKKAKLKIPDLQKPIAQRAEVASK